MNVFENNLSPRAKPLLLWALLFSLVLHVFAVIYMNWRPAYAPMAEPQAIEVVDVPTEDFLRKKVAQAKRPKEIAETEKLKNDEVDPNARFLSDKNQKAEKQTRAKQVDDFRKHEGTGLLSDAKTKGVIPPTSEEKQKSKISASDMDGIPLHPTPNAGIKRNWKTLSMKDLSILGNGLPMGATDDRLDGVADGNQTVLSTREFQYYSYYYRIKQTLRQYWKPNVERRLAVIWSRGTKLKDGEMVTQLLVMLDQKGEVAKISTVASSGIRDIDDAAVEAFHKASPFPNPPRGIIDQDGLVRIRWDFILKAQAGPSIQFRRPSGGMPP